MKWNSQRRYSLDEYFSVEQTSQVKNEYYDGEIFAMAGASLQHNRIAANLLALIRPALTNNACEAFGSDLRVQTPGGLFTYPDISIVCGEPQLLESRPDTLTNPIVLIEVLSDATRDYDRGQKFALYKEIPSLREYIVVEQVEVFVEAFRLVDGIWQTEAHRDLQSVLPIPSVSLTVPVHEIYRLVFS